MIKNINILEIIFTIFAFFAWSRAFLRYRESKISSKDLVLWTIIWGGMVALVFTPGKADFIAAKFGVREGNDLIFFLGISILFYIVYRVYVRLGEIEREITQLVRMLSLEKDGKRKKRK